MLTLDQNPPMLAPWVQTLADLPGPWWVGHTRSRFEKTFAWDMLRRNIGFYLPMVERVTVSHGVKRRALLPMFSGYVFFCGTEADRYAALATNRLCQAIRILDQESVARELLSIERAMANKAQLDPYPFAAQGQRCRVTSGPFQGLEGIVVQRTNLARLVLQVTILGQGASLEIDVDLLEPIA